MNITNIDGFTIRLVIAMFLGLLIGLERQIGRHSVNITTNVTVCVGAYLFTAVGFMINGNNIDLTRIPAQIVCGVGFIGAGVILRNGSNIKGLNTAATVWTTAAIGVMCCFENIYYAVISGVFIAIINLILHPLSKHINNSAYKNKDKRSDETYYKITIICEEDAVSDIKKYTTELIRTNPRALLKRLESEDTPDEKIKIKAFLAAVERDNSMIEDIAANISVTKGVKRLGWKELDDLE